MAGTGVGRRALVVEDERPLGELLAGYLLRDGFEPTVVHDGESALAAARAREPDVVILDIGLPGMDGYDVCRRLREFSGCYVLLLTARGEESDKVAGLDVGADDYVTKPFSPREVMARIAALLRRPRTWQITPGDRPARSRVLEFGRLRIDLDRREVAVDDEIAVLTRTEFDLLAALATRPERVAARSELIREVWGDNWYGDEHLVDVHLGHLRRKLGDDAASAVFVLTVRGVGYRIGPGR